MFFLNERLIAAFLSILAFFISFVTCLYTKVAPRVLLLRSLVWAFIFLVIGLFFGKLIKSLIVEAFVEPEEEAGTGEKQGVPPKKEEMQPEGENVKEEET